MDAGFLTLLALFVTAMAGCVSTILTARIARRNGIEAGREAAVELCRRRRDAAIHTFLLRLEKLIAQPYEPDFVTARAHSLVRLGDCFCSHVASLSAALNADIDRLRKTLAALRKHPDDVRLKQELHCAIARLHDTWPRKRHALAVILRELLSQLGYMDDDFLADDDL